MKKWWNPVGTSLGSAASSYGDVASSIAQSVKQRAAALGVDAGDKSKEQYLRLPLESARRLRWYEVGDVNSLVRQHAMDKQSLSDCILALRKCMVERGLEVRLVAHAVACDSESGAGQQCTAGCIHKLPLPLNHS